MPLLPLELVEAIIDIVAECCPESLPNCALVSHQWTPRSTHHIGRILRTPIITTSGTLHILRNIVTEHPHLATLTTSLSIAPDPEFSLIFTSFIPFHHLSSRVLPNIRHLALGETLRWGDYPLVYRKAISGFFSAVVSLHLSCQFNSVSDLFHLIRSFRGVNDVPLVYPHHIAPRWMFNRTHIPRRHDTSIRETFQLQRLELSLAILKPILTVCGDLVVNLSVICPRMSTISVGVVYGKEPGFLRPMSSLEEVEITVPVESDDPTNHAGLGKLDDLLLAPIQAAKPGVQCLFHYVKECREHYSVQYFRPLGIRITTFKEVIPTLLRSRMEITLKPCRECLIEGKSDDWIMSKNTLNCNTRQIEDNAREKCHGLIDECLVVGNGRPSPALFVELGEGVSMDDTRASREIITRIRPFHARRYLHERIASPKMIVVVPRGSLLTTEIRGSVCRQTVEEQYRVELDAMFADEW